MPLKITIGAQISFKLNRLNDSNLTFYFLNYNKCPKNKNNNRTTSTIVALTE